MSKQISMIISEFYVNYTDTSAEQLTQFPYLFNKK